MSQSTSVSQIQCGLCTDLIEYDLEPQLVYEVYWLDCNHMCHMDCVGLDEIHRLVYCYLCAHEQRVVAKTFQRIPMILSFMREQTQTQTQNRIADRISIIDTSSDDSGDDDADDDSSSVFILE